MPKIPNWLTKVFAFLAGILIFAVVALLNEIGADMLRYHLPRLGPWTWSHMNYPLVVDYQRIGQIFDLGYPAVVALSTVYFFWKGIPRQSFRIVLYLLLLALVGPLTFINYIMSDQWLNLWVQSAFNVFVAFVGYVFVLKIREQKASSADVKALQSLSILGIASLLVALPLFYTGIFLSVALHLVDHHAVQSLSEKIPLTVAGLVEQPWTSCETVRRWQNPKQNEPR